MGEIGPHNLLGIMSVGKNWRFYRDTSLLRECLNDGLAPFEGWENSERSNYRCVQNIYEIVSIL